MATALILGITGGIGGEMAAGFLRSGWTVRGLARDPAKRPIEGVEMIAGDAMRAEDVRAAAEGCGVIVHAVNPPGYRDWDKLVLPMIDNTIAAARAVGARIVLPGTIYNYGSDAFPLLRETSPQNPRTRKGAIRVEMERRLAMSGVRALVVRAGDFFGERAANSWFSQGMVKPGRPVMSISLPGPGVAHTWGYLPDVAETMLRLLEREADLATFETFHMAGHVDPDGRGLAEAIRRVADQDAKIKNVPWALFMLAAPFVTFLRELKEMRYLWREPLLMDNAKLVALLGAEPHTPGDARGSRLPGARRASSRHGLIARAERGGGYPPPLDRAGSSR